MILSESISYYYLCNYSIEDEIHRQFCLHIAFCTYYKSANTELELRVRDSWIMISWPHQSKIRKTTTNVSRILFFPKYDNFKVISAGNICLFVCLELSE